MKLDIRIKIDMIKLLAKGVRCNKYMSAVKALRSTRCRALAAELAEDIEGGAGPIYLINYKNAKIVVLPDHVHVVGVESEEEAKKIVEELASIMEGRT